MLFAFIRSMTAIRLMKGDASMILFYAADNNRVVETLEHQLADYRINRCRCFDTMVKRLRTPRHGLEVALVVVTGRDEMAHLSGIRNLFRDLRLVVVLPRRDDGTVAWAHTLGPRFIAYADNGYQQVGAVMEKMIHSAHRQTAFIEGGQPE